MPFQAKIHCNLVSDWVKLDILCMEFKLFGLAGWGDSSLVNLFSCNNSDEVFWDSKLLYFGILNCLRQQHVAYSLQNLHLS